MKILCPWVKLLIRLMMSEKMSNKVIIVIISLFMRTTNYLTKILYKKYKTNTAFQAIFEKITQHDTFGLI